MREEARALAFLRHFEEEREGQEESEQNLPGVLEEGAAGVAEVGLGEVVDEIEHGLWCFEYVICGCLFRFERRIMSIDLQFEIDDCFKCEFSFVAKGGGGGDVWGSTNTHMYANTDKCTIYNQSQK